MFTCAASSLLDTMWTSHAVLAETTRMETQVRQQLHFRLHGHTFTATCPSVNGNWNPSLSLPILKYIKKGISCSHISVCNIELQTFSSSPLPAYPFHRKWFYFHKNEWSHRFGWGGHYRQYLGFGNLNQYLPHVSNFPVGMATHQSKCAKMTNNSISTASKPKMQKCF